MSDTTPGTGIEYRCDDRGHIWIARITRANPTGGMKPGDPCPFRTRTICRGQMVATGRIVR
jgi:hypothetical protein